MIILGTPYFINKQKAIAYYREYNYNCDIVDIVNRKIKEKEIYIGKPIIKENETLKINSEGRYLKIIK